jgi:hypothetical protein
MPHAYASQTVLFKVLRAMWPFATHGGRNYLMVPMSINFNLWFSPGGTLPGESELRVYQQDGMHPQQSDTSTFCDF